MDAGVVMRPIMKIALGDVVRLKKDHPCGSKTWEVIRTGADIKIKCQGCGRIVMMPRSQFERRVKEFIRPKEGDHGLPQER
jgi:hypothetical protein